MYIRIMHVYLDLGANWANTLNLFENVPCPSQTLWNIVAFEASPLVQPFLSEYVAFANGESPHEPENCLPRSGSTLHLLKYARKYGCPTSSDAGRKCMWRCLNHHLNRLSPDTALNSSLVVNEALRKALVPPAVRHAYTLVPAAVGARDGWTTIYESPQQLIRGGALQRSADWSMKPKKVLTVDVAKWLLNVPEDAYVFAKIDIEGSEHALIERLEELGSFRRLSRVSIECHGSHGKCKKTMRRLKSWNVTLITENVHQGMDSRAIAHLQRPIPEQCRSCS